MPHEAHSPIGPDAPDALEPQFRIEGAFAVRAVLRELMTRRALVTLYPEDRIDDALVTRIVHVDTDGVEPMASTEAVTLPMREDVVTDGGDPQRVLSNAPRSEKSFFVVPKVVE